MEETHTVDTTEEMAAKSTKTIALEKRISRMRKELSWSALIVAMIDQVARKVLSGGTAVGTNILLFGIVGIGVYYFCKRQLSKLDPESFVWRSHNPWRFFFWPLAGLMLVFFTLRYSR